MAVSHLDRVNASKRAGGQINLGATASVITDSMVSANSASLSGLRAAVVSIAAICRPDFHPIAIKTIQALDVYKDLSIVAENHGLSNVAALVSASDVDSTSRRMGIW
jgi:transketolase C-terminal domain/subunit